MPFVTLRIIVSNDGHCNITSPHEQIRANRIRENCFPKTHQYMNTMLAKGIKIHGEQSQQGEKAALSKHKLLIDQTIKIADWTTTPGKASERERDREKSPV